MQTEDVAVSAMVVVGHSGVDLLEVVKARLYVSIRQLGYPWGPSPAVEVGTRRVHHTVERDAVAMGIAQIAALDMQGWQGYSVDGGSVSTERGQASQQGKEKAFRNFIIDLFRIIGCKGRE